MAIKRLSTILLLFFACTAFAQSWQSKEAVRIENTESSFHYTFRDSTTLYIQKQNISYIVSLPNSNYIQVGYLYEGATSKIMSCTYNTLTQPALGSNAELADTLNAWLNEPSSGGGGGGVQSVVAGTNITIDNTDPNNPIISATDSASSLFPNGVKLVLSSRDFQADDKDFVLYCPVPSTTITMPTTNPFSEGDYVGVVMSSPDSYFETYNNGSGGTDKIYPYTQNPSGTTLEQQSSSEVVILRATNTGSVKLLPLSGAIKESDDINGSNFKTLSRYNYDKSEETKIIELGTITYEDVNNAPSATSVNIYFANDIPAGTYIENIYAIVENTFNLDKIKDNEIKFSSANMYLPDGNIAEFNIKADFSGNYILFQPPNNTYIRPEISRSSFLKFDFDLGGGEVNPQDFTQGQVIFKALVRKSPF